ncbi:MAG: PH domain-containing protein [Chloroflexia bacterium]|nr:PH domain-containing protein [Chloroflexia bacterium]
MSMDLAAADVAPRRQHPAVILLDVGRSLSALILPLLVLAISRGEDNRQLWFLGIGGVWLVISAIYQFVAWRQFTFEVTGSELRVHSGVLERKERLVPLERIQAVDIHETPLQRLAGVVGVRVETAAGGAEGADVKIGALTRADAELLRRRLGVTRQSRPVAATSGPGLGTGPVTPANGELIRRLSTPELLLAAVTSGTIGPALAVVGFASQVIDDILPEEIWSRLALDATALSPRALIPLVVLVAVIAWLLAIAGTVLTYGGFELRRFEDRVIISHGLLERRRRTVPVARMQAIVVTEGLLRRPLGLASVSFESAGYGQESGESGVLWPLLRRTEAVALVASVAPSLATAIERRELAGPPPRALSRYLVADVASWLALCGIVLGIGWFLTSGLVAWLTWFQWWWGGLLLIGLPVVGLNAVLRFRDAGWRIDPAQLLVISNGGLTRKTTIVPRRRIQFQTVNRNVFQRRADLATLHMAIASGGAGGGAAVDHLDAGVAFGIVDRLGPAGGQPVADDWTAERTMTTETSDDAARVPSQTKIPHGSDEKEDASHVRHD